MKIKRLLFALVVSGLACGSVVGTRAAETVLTPDLKKIAAGIGGTAAPQAALRWDADAKGKGALFSKSVVWLEGVTFSDGAIECDILGKSLPRGSNFLGIAFRGADDVTYDCVYFRPFNFRAPNPENSSHAVQYISHPTWTWQKLRAERTGQYEKPIAPPPDGDAWFHAKIVVSGRKVRVFVNGAPTPSLEVETLNARTGGRLGLWGGDAGDGGHFANLTITPAGK